MTQDAKQGAGRAAKATAKPDAEARKAELDRKRRESVLKAARKVFESHGLEGASMRMIAQKARCTTGSIYPYFKGKEEIYAEVLSRSLQEYREHLQADVARAQDPRERFAAVLRAHFDHYEHRAEDMALALYLFNGLKPQGLTRELDARLNEQLASIMLIFRECVQSLTPMDDAAAREEVGEHYSVLFGLLIFVHTRRSRVLGIEPRAVLENHIRHAVERLGGPAAMGAPRRSPRRKPAAN